RTGFAAMPRDRRRARAGNWRSCSSTAESRRRPPRRERECAIERLAPGVSRAGGRPSLVELGAGVGVDFQADGDLDDLRFLPHANLLAGAARLRRGTDE